MMTDTYKLIIISMLFSSNIRITFINKPFDLQPNTTAYMKKYNNDKMMSECKCVVVDVKDLVVVDSCFAIWSLHSFTIQSVYI